MNVFNFVLKSFKSLQLLGLFFICFSQFIDLTNIDLTNGSGICTAWSIAYLMINATKSIKSFRLYPIALTTFATANAVGYGKTFMNEY